jgi:hypothetical protein
METLFHRSSYLKPSYLLPKPSKNPIMLSSNSLRINFNYFPNSYLSSSSSSFSGQFSLQINPTKSLPLILNAGKKDNHSFVPKSDEVTGFFPESVLLKKVTFFNHTLRFFVLFIIHFSVVFCKFCFKKKMPF